MTTIRVSKDFSSTPGGRVRAMGPDSGEAFRDYLLKALRKNRPKLLRLFWMALKAMAHLSLKKRSGG